MRLLLFTLLFVGGTWAFGIEECADMIDLEELKEKASLPDANELDVICDPLQRFIRCLEDLVKEHTGLTLEQLLPFVEQEEVRRGINLFINMRNLIGDVCDENSELHREYVESAACYKTVKEEDKCLADAKAAYSAYQVFQSTANEVGERRRRDTDDDDNDDDLNCMVQAYMLACLSAEIMDQCGQQAHETFLKIVKRSTILKNGLCSQEDVRELKTSFLDTLELHEDRRSLFALAFDIKRRRK